MKYVIVLLLTGCTLFEDFVPPSKEQYKSKKRYYVISGQSNAGPYTTAQLGKVDSVKCWNYYTNRFENKVDVSRQLYLKVGGVIVPLAKELKKKYPHDSLYFIQFHKGGTNLAVQWNVKSNQLFKTLIGVLDKSLVGAKDVTFIWIQGEADSRVKDQADKYQVNEKKLFDSLKLRYDVKKVINYQLPDILDIVISPYKGVVMTAKTKTGGVLINPNGCEYLPDKRHLTIKGTGQLGKAIAEKL